MVAAALPPTQVQVPDVTPLMTMSLYGLAIVVVGMLIALAIVMPGTESKDRAATIRELVRAFLGFRGGGPPPGAV